MNTATYLYDEFRRGGPVMWPIALAALLAAAVILERSIWWIVTAARVRAAGLDAVFDSISAGDFTKAAAATGDAADPYRRTLHAGLTAAPSSLSGAMQITASDELEAAERNQWVLGTLITVAPLLGLLGTITGIMKSFNFVGDEQLAASKVSGGIAEALIATAAGLCIAIACLLPFNYFNRRIGRLRAGLERAINHTEILIESARRGNQTPVVTLSAPAAPFPATQLGEDF